MASRYSRDATIEVLHGYFKSLTTIPAFPEAAIVEPPTGGWPNMTSESLSNLNKDEVVFDLLRHLPHVSAVDYGNDKIAYETRTINYNDKSVRSDIERNKMVGTIVPVGAGKLPAHVAVLTEGGRYGSWLLLDTHKGTITDYIMMERPERDTPPQDAPDHWRAYKTLPIAEFFEDWKEQFRSLNWVALAHRGEDGVLLNHNASTEVSLMDTVVDLVQRFTDFCVSKGYP